ncbi:VWA domain-containing protein [Reichenbachiella carrageenanivorans]|uniref:VWA domain-containing protein n=1 Tax=Reichenbachiella carrageenanivorans TaxID=2979869 RepID=A0ABY6CXY9_9BACT|nr:VWA domain-containing protein [Reichenbachiella carrageenanivorans]UXX78775.1 VWA domain-containing protein [Reichenbachiella carrageenanivorans]
MLDGLFPIDWEVFHFLRPLFLWLLVPVVVILLIGLVSFAQETRWKTVIAPHLRPYVIRKGNQRTKAWMNLALLLMLGLGVLALAGPTWKKIKLPGRILETPMVILLDMSQSMMAEDLQPNRLERAKFKIQDLLEKNPRARVALVGFAGTAHAIVPLSWDYEIINSHVKGLKPSVMPFPGSDLSAALMLADTIMSVTDAPGTVLILSDDFEDAHFSLLKDFTEGTQNKIEILAMNTAGGSTIPNPWGRGTIKDKDGHPAYSSLNQLVLNKLGSLEGVTVNALTLDDSDVEVISKKIAAHLTFTEQPKEKKDDWRDAGLLLVFPMALLSLFWFRKGWVIYAVPLLLLSSCGQVETFEDLWFTKDYQGQRLTNEANYELAGDRFEDLMHKGVAFYKAGDYEQAIKAFNQDTTANGAYNLGLAYFQSGDTVAALLSFNQAVALDSTLMPAQHNQQVLSQLAGVDHMSVGTAIEEANKPIAKNESNKSMEDLSGGGQEATKKDMEKKRLEENVASDIHKGKELDMPPKDMDIEIQKQNDTQIMMQKVDDDPSIFLQRKFEYQIRKDHIKPQGNETKW